MAFEIRYSHESIQQLKRLRAFDRTTILDQIEQVLAVNPTMESKTRVKRLRQPAPTECRLRVGDFRVFYNVLEDVVEVVQILTKEEAEAFLEEQS